MEVSDFAYCMVIHCIRLQPEEYCTCKKGYNRMVAVVIECTILSKETTGESAAVWMVYTDVAGHI